MEIFLQKKEIFVASPVPMYYFVITTIVMPLEVVDVCDDDGVSGESLIGKAGAMPAFLF